MSSFGGPVVAVNGAPPLSGVKRPLQGNPTSVPRNLPAFRGRDATPPGSAIKAPKLNPSNLPNRQTNVTIPVARVSPLVAGYNRIGRTSPGDVLFMQRRPVGFLSKTLSHYGVESGSMNYMIGLDEMNRRLRGLSAKHGWVMGENVMKRDIDKSADDEDMFTMSPFVKDRQAVFGVNPKTSKPLLSVLEDWTYDGICLSNDQQYDEGVHDSTQNVVFNVCAQGRCQVNNGYLGYADTADAVRRTIEANPRGSVEAGLKNSVNIVTSHKYAWNGGQHFVDRTASFGGSYTTYPLQMFDRRPMMMDSLYLGLRAYEIPRESVAGLPEYDATKYPDGVEIADSTNKDGKLGGVAADNPNGLKSNEKLYFVQYVPFSGRAANLINKLATSQYLVELLKQGIADGTYSPAERVEVAKVIAEREEEIRQAKVASTANSNTCLKPPFVKEANAKFAQLVSEFDAIREVDLMHLVGAWHVGKVLDIKASKLQAYDSGPADTGISVTIDAQTQWMPWMDEAKIDDGFAWLSGESRSARAIVQQRGSNIRKALTEVMREFRDAPSTGTGSLPDEAQLKLSYGLLNSRMLNKRFGTSFYEQKGQFKLNLTHAMLDPRYDDFGPKPLQVLDAADETALDEFADSVAFYDGVLNQQWLDNLVREDPGAELLLYQTRWMSGVATGIELLEPPAERVYDFMGKVYHALLYLPMLTLFKSQMFAGTIPQFEEAKRRLDAFAASAAKVAADQGLKLAHGYKFDDTKAKYDELMTRVDTALTNIYKIFPGAQPNIAMINFKSLTPEPIDVNSLGSINWVGPTAKEPASKDALNANVLFNTSMATKFTPDDGKASFTAFAPVRNFFVLDMCWAVIVSTILQAAGEPVFGTYNDPRQPIPIVTSVKWDDFAAALLWRVPFDAVYETTDVAVVKRILKLFILRDTYDDGADYDTILANLKEVLAPSKNDVTYTSFANYFLGGDVIKSQIDRYNDTSRYGDLKFVPKPSESAADAKRALGAQARKDRQRLRPMLKLTGASLAPGHSLIAKTRRNQDLLASNALLVESRAKLLRCLGMDTSAYLPGSGTGMPISMPASGSTATTTASAGVAVPRPNAAARSGQSAAPARATAAVATPSQVAPPSQAAVLPVRAAAPAPTSSSAALEAPPNAPSLLKQQQEKKKANPGRKQVRIMPDANSPVSIPTPAPHMAAIAVQPIAPSLLP
jgi:hypothetical protein